MSVGEVSVRANVIRETVRRRNARSGNCTSGKYPLENCPSAKCRKNVCRGNVRRGPVQIPYWYCWNKNSKKIILTREYFIKLQNLHLLHSRYWLFIKLNSSSVYTYTFLQAILWLRPSCRKWKRVNEEVLLLAEMSPSNLCDMN